MASPIVEQVLEKVAEIQMQKQAAKSLAEFFAEHPKMYPAAFGTAIGVGIAPEFSYYKDVADIKKFIKQVREKVNKGELTKEQARKIVQEVLPVAQSRLKKKGYGALATQAGALGGLGALEYYLKSKEHAGRTALEAFKLTGKMPKEIPGAKEFSTGAAILGGVGGASLAGLRHLFRAAKTRHQVNALNQLLKELE